MALELMTKFHRCHVILLASLSYRRSDSREPARSSVVFQIQSALPKNFLAALVECIAATVLYALEQSFHCLKPHNPLPELRDFPLRELMPAFRWTRPGREPEKELAYFIQGEPPSLERAAPPPDEKAHCHRNDVGRSFGTAVEESRSARSSEWPRCANQTPARHRK